MESRRLHKCGMRRMFSQDTAFFAIKSGLNNMHTGNDTFVCRPVLFKRKTTHGHAQVTRGTCCSCTKYLQDWHIVHSHFVATHRVMPERCSTEINQLFLDLLLFFIQQPLWVVIVRDAPKRALSPKLLFTASSHRVKRQSERKLRALWIMGVVAAPKRPQKMHFNLRGNGTQTGKSSLTRSYRLAQDITRRHVDCYTTESYISVVQLAAWPVIGIRLNFLAWVKVHKVQSAWQTLSAFPGVPTVPNMNSASELFPYVVRVRIPIHIRRNRKNKYVALYAKLP